ncbi:hypothetical protein ACSFV5_16830 [Acinetobacter sp. HC8-3S]
MTLEQLQQSINQLYWWDGHERQAALERLSNCYEPILFPHLLRKLSDYVPINRQLAAQHLLIWVERPEGADLCIDYFLDVYAIQKRVRIVGEVEDVLVNKVAQNLDKVKSILQFKQGKLSRALFDYAQKNELFTYLELLEIAKLAHDQGIRLNWINFIVQQQGSCLKQEYVQTQYFDVKKAILYKLFEIEELDIKILLNAFNSSSLSIMDFSIFALKNQGFDFNEYFYNLRSSILSNEKIKSCLLQMILLKWSKQDFYLYIDKLEDKSILFMVLYKALKSNYILSSEVVDLLHRRQVKLQFHLLRKFVGLGGFQPQEVDELYHMSGDSIKLIQRLDIYENFSFWDKFEYLTLLWRYCRIQEEKHILKEKVEELLNLVKYQYYAPIWKKDNKDRAVILFEAMMNEYNLMSYYRQEYQQLKKILLK